MLPKENRLKNKKEIDQIFKNGKTVRNSFLFLKYEKNNLEISKFAFSIGLKYSKKAAERNRLKRILRATTFLFIKEIKKGYNGIFFVSPNLTTEKKLNIQELQEIMKNVLKKANILINK